MGELFAIGSGIVGLVGYAPYIRDIVIGKTRPERISWLIWAIEYSVLFWAQFAAGARSSLWLIGLQLIGIACICCLSVRAGSGSFSRYTVALLASICASLVVWYFTANATLAIIILILVEASGIVLTARKAYAEPGSETIGMWLCLCIAGMLSVISIGYNASYILYVYPLSLCIMGLTIIGAVRVGTAAKRSQDTMSILAYNHICQAGV
jgi:hypothetical protein